MKPIALLLVLLVAAAAGAQTKAPCRMNLYIQTAQGAPESTGDATANLFLYGLRSAVRQHQGCIVNKMADANLDLYVTTLKLPSARASMAKSVVTVALAVPLHGVPVYIDDYVFVVRDTDNIEARANSLLSSIGATLVRYTEQTP